MKAQIVSFHCVLKDKMGKVIGSTFNHEVLTLPPGPGELLEGLSKGLQNLKKGERRRICLSADEAYGFYDPSLTMEVSRRDLEGGAAVQSGHQVLARGGDGQIRTYRVTETAGDRISLDANHPLAGQDLVFDIEATDARDATPEEIEESVPKGGDSVVLH